MCHFVEFQRHASRICFYRCIGVITVDISSARQTSRKLYLDALRIIAIIAVVFNHTKTHGYAFFLNATESAFFPLYIFCSSFCKIAVPIFLMISGALLLKKEEPILVILKKRFLKFFIVLFLVSLIIHMYYLQWKFQEFSFALFIQELYSTGTTTSLWYLYAFLSYLLMLPFLRKLAKNMHGKDYLYLTGLMFFAALFQCLEFAVWDYSIHLHPNFELFSVSKIVFYPLIGDYLANKLDDNKVTGKHVFLLCAIGFLFTVVNCWLTCKWCEHLGEWNINTFETFISQFIFVPAMAVFVLARYLFSKIKLSSVIQKSIVHIGSCTFGIYLFERIYRKETLFIFNALSAHIPDFLACIVWVFCVIIIGLVITSIIKKIPILRNLL